MASETPVSEHVHHNIHTIQRLQRSADAKVGKHQRAVERITHGMGRPASLYALLAFPVLWIALAYLAPRLGWTSLDASPFPLLQGMVTFYGACVATAVLTAQSRQRRDAERRAQLELQVSLLAEQKATKIISLLEELRRDLPIVKNREDPEARAMGENIDAHAVISALQAQTGSDSVLPAVEVDADPTSAESTS